MWETIQNKLKMPTYAALTAFLIIAFCITAYVTQYYIFIFLPVFALAIYCVIYFPKQLLIFLVFATPLSFNFENIGAFGGIGFYFPTEPVLFGIMVLYIVRLLSGVKERKELMRHPLTMAIVVNLIWISITAMTSTMPIVSFKFLLSRLWFILVIYFMINSFFKDEKFIYKFLKAYIFGLTITIVYTVFRHASRGFSEDAAHWVMWPFFKDHTSYGAIIALFYPLVVFLLYKARRYTFEQFFALAIFGVFTIGLILSYTRAAWVSLVGALFVYFLIKWRINYKLVLLAGLVLFGFYLGFEEQITHQLRSNRQDSSNNITEHIQSITNISSDASNLERLNRWNSAMRMFEDKPILGYGPGTYMFKYAIFQKNADRTIISTNSGDGGNSHSEYLGPLSESGVLGTLTILIIFILSLTTGIRLYYQLDDKPFLKGIVLSIVLGLVTYYLHGILNNYLDTDKASVPVWGMMSILVAVEIYHIRSGSYLNLQQSSEVSSK